MQEITWNNETLITNNKGLLVPPSFIKSSKEYREEVTNGCGPEGILEEIIPDQILGVSVKNSCLIHDWMFHHSENESQAEVADNVFRANLLAELKRKSESEADFLSFVRKLISKIYFFSVRFYSFLRK